MSTTNIDTRSYPLLPVLNEKYIYILFSITKDCHCIIRYYFLHNKSLNIIILQNLY